MANPYCLDVMKRNSLHHGAANLAYMCVRNAAPWREKIVCERREFLVHVALVAAVLLHISEVSSGFLSRLIAVGGDDFDEGGFDVFCHAGSITANVEAGTAFEPSPKLCPLLNHEVLDVDFLFCIARPGDRELQSTGSAYSGSR